MAEPVVYDNLEQLIARINAHMTENHNNENTGARTNQLLKEVVLGLLAIIGNVPTGAASIQPWNDGMEYTDQVIVSHNGFLWLFVGSGADTGTQPGTDNDIWIGLGTAIVPQLAQVLAAGERTGTNDIGIDAGRKIIFRDTESEGKLKLYHEPITDDNELKLPNKSGVLAVTADIAALNLKRLAHLDDTNRLADDIAIVQPGHGFAAGAIVDHNGTEWRMATDRALAMVMNTDGDGFVLLRYGVFKNKAFNETVAGTAYYLDGGPGSYTDEKVGPLAFIALGDDTVFFCPDQSVPASGYSMLDGDVASVTRADTGGQSVGLHFISDKGGAYRIKLYSKLVVDTAPGRKAIVGLSGADTIMATCTSQYGSVGESEVNAINPDGRIRIGNFLPPNEEMTCMIDGVVTVPAHGMLEITLGNDDGATTVYMKDASIFTWEKID